MKRFATLLAVAVCLVSPLFADEGHHHEQPTAQQLGTVHFPVSCTPVAQEQFRHGVALLHSFWYEEAEKTFESAGKSDPTCAMAQWGVAMSLWHQLWDTPEANTIERGTAAVNKGLALHPRTQRERDYLEAAGAYYLQKKGTGHEARAQAYSAAMKRVYEKYPADHEAAAFYALSLLASEPDEDTTFANRKQAAQILEKLFTIEPNHPGIAHYLIHSYDKPQLAELGLPAARRYAKIAPASPHALHMPSHIFARRGLWQDDIDSNLASIAATRKTSAMHMGGAGHQFHAMDFLDYAYLQSGHEKEAQALLAEVQAMPPMKSMYGDEEDERTIALVIFPARYALEMRHWSDAAALEPVPGAAPGDNAITYWAKAIGAARSGNVAAAQKAIDQLGEIHKTLADKNRKIGAMTVDFDSKEATAWLDHASGKDEEALGLLREVADHEDSVGERTDVGVPAREMLADLLLELKRPDQALAEYTTSLKFNPNRFSGLYGAGRAAEMAGKTSQASEFYAQLVKNCEGSSSDRPELSQARGLVARK